MIKSLTLTYDQVARILEQHINAEILRTPQRVTAVDPWDWDASNEHQFSISLAPFDDGAIGERAADPAVERLVQTVLHIPPVPANGNGTPPVDLPLHIGGQPVTAVTPIVSQEATQVASATEAPKKRTRPGHTKLSDDDRFQIVRLRAEYGTAVKDLAKRFDVSEATIYHVLAETRSAARRDGNNRLPTSHRVLARLQVAQRVHELPPAAPKTLRFARRNRLETSRAPAFTRNQRHYGTRLPACCYPR